MGYSGVRMAEAGLQTNPTERDIQPCAESIQFAYNCDVFYPQRLAFLSRFWVRVSHERAEADETLGIGISSLEEHADCRTD